MYFRTSDPTATIANVTDAHLSTKQLAQTTLRNVGLKKDFSDYGQKLVSLTYFLGARNANVERNYVRSRRHRTACTNITR